VLLTPGEFSLNELIASSVLKNFLGEAWPWFNLNAEASEQLLGQVGIQQSIPFPMTAQQRLDLTNATVEEIEQRYAARIPTPKPGPL